MHRFPVPKQCTDNQSSCRNQTHPQQTRPQCCPTWRTASAAPTRPLRVPTRTHSQMPPPPGCNPPTLERLHLPRWRQRHLVAQTRTR
ncbi:hypothetical protein BCR44DRAFT_1424075 [Catenaria anguillulae PL171]|uniref:Uncharacterized protein n=1 Tax=Catenaria anguillulae PL171 TaxID=765915 RepID=A0A1Y2I2G3_9FUNG|nr:hypothetical protein BCR44DRAFT_1424075 [Catenaria anguillulae PL171]